MRHTSTLILGLLFILISEISFSQAIIIDHNCSKLEPIPESAIQDAKDNLHIAYDHTSHGSQLITGMSALIGQTSLVGYKGDIYNFNNGGTNNALDLHDYFSPTGDLGYEDDWAPATRTYLDAPENSDVNVIIWSWCNIYGHDIAKYLTNMELLISEYGPGGTRIIDQTRTVAVTFVFMTGHTNAGSAENEWTFNANKQIRQHCIDNNRVLYDFYDIECYNPNDEYFGDGDANASCYGTFNGLKDLEDNCTYNIDGGGRGNWATEWRAAHSEGTHWYNCSPAHTDALNGNLKAYAAWWLWCRLAGWEGIANIEDTNMSSELTFEIFPNPASDEFKINFTLKDNSQIDISIYDITGKFIKTLANKNLKSGNHQYKFQRNNLQAGTYFIKMRKNNSFFTKKIILTY